jgi:ubiquinone/menaquinone biosynthesis C-methylase UbiE
MGTTAASPERKDRGMEGMVAKWYTKNTGKALGEFKTLAQRIAKQLAPRSAVLEVAPGPGYFCIELAQLGQYAITGLDLSQTFVEIARKKAGDAGVKVDFRQGNASNMPFVNDTFDFLLCRAAFKNFGQPVAALQEMARVLKTGGRGLIIDLDRDATPVSINQAVDAMGLSAFNRLLTKFIFRTSLIKSAYTKMQFQNMLMQAGFTTFDIEYAAIGFEISVTK